MENRLETGFFSDTLYLFIGHEHAIQTSPLTLSLLSCLLLISYITHKRLNLLVKSIKDATALAL